MFSDNYLRSAYLRSLVILIVLFYFDLWLTYFACRTRAYTPAARGAALDVPSKFSIHSPCKSVVTCKNKNVYHICIEWDIIKLMA